MNRVAGGILTLFAQVNEIAPGRAKGSDGTFPSPEHHILNPGSDHEPHAVPWTTDLICTAGDFTHDPTGGFDADVFAEQLRLGRDPRIKYVIRRQRMFSSYEAHGIPAWTWRDYTGTYHGDHAHVSEVDAIICDSRAPWRINMSFDLDADIDFTALKNRVYHGLQNLEDPIDIGLKDAAGKPRTEPNKLAQKLAELSASFKAMADTLASMNTQLAQILLILQSTPDHEPSQVDRETVKLGVQDAFAEGFGPHAVP